MKKLGVVAALALCAVSASASNFRGGDQIYVPAIGHLGGISGTFISDVFISNLSTDSVDVSVIFAEGPGGTQPGRYHHSPAPHVKGQRAQMYARGMSPRQISDFSK